MTSFHVLDSQLRQAFQKCPSGKAHLQVKFISNLSLSKIFQGQINARLNEKNLVKLLNATWSRKNQ